jgi:hypothetical protein
MLQINAHVPVVSNGEPVVQKMTKEQFWDKYKQIGEAEGLAAKNKFYKENKNLIS